MNTSKRSLEDCLAGIHTIATEVERKVSKQAEAERTGFVQFPLMLQRSLVSHMPLLLPSNALVIELGCGIGSFTSMSAAAGFRSYGIDCNPYLIKVARHIHSVCKDQGYVDRNIECQFAIGNMHYERTMKSMHDLSKLHLQITLIEHLRRYFHLKVIRTIPMRS